MERHRLWPLLVIVVGLLLPAVTQGWPPAIDDYLSSGWSFSGDFSGEERRGRWYAVNDVGTYVVYGNRIVLFEGVDAPEDVSKLMVDLVLGGFWKEGNLLTQEIFFRHVWKLLPNYAHQLLSVSSQLWVMLAVYRSLAQVVAPLFTFLNDYRKTMTGDWYEGAMPILVNDAELSFQFFAQVAFPKKITDPVTVELDRVPSMANIPMLTRPFPYANPWGELHKEMETSGISRVRLGGAINGSFELHYRNPSANGREQLISAALDSIYQPVPWLFEVIRQKVPRQEIRLYASLLSQDALELAAQMLSCHREHPNLQAGEKGLCLSGVLESVDGGLFFRPRVAVVLPQIWEERNYNTGRVLPLSGCNFNSRPLCWENYLVLGDLSVLFRQPPMTLYTRFASFAERNRTILLNREPQIWYQGSYFQVRIPELVSRFALGLIGVAGQVAVNRLVVSMHHGIWGNGAPSKPKDDQVIPESQLLEDHEESEAIDCKLCDGPCQYPRCGIGGCGRYQPGTLVDFGCQGSHKVCFDCLKRHMNVANIRPCRNCEKVHWNKVNPRSFQHDGNASSRDAPTIPICPLCRAELDYRKGNLMNFLGEECSRLSLGVLWLFSDGFRERADDGDG
ncbi:hypothetical protein [Parendozoicomonas sp. Alg238-R29]|uniref:hypothetical protein n=1 Tax=Parendozoicomonas sp. Alg238-R29 TaxID=2993446 RepID=UPI00248EF440|nr:hypothetical protein [Parendozoicomonas sp. Alg238-R29]